MRKPSGDEREKSRTIYKLHLQNSWMNQLKSEMRKIASRKEGHGRKRALFHAATCCMSLACNQPSANAFTIVTYHKGVINRRNHYQSSVVFTGAASSDATAAAHLEDDRHRPQQHEHHRPLHQQESTSPDSSYEWKVGNVYDDLDNLRREITKSNAEQHLRQVQDRERLDTFAANRRPLHRDVRRFILQPLALSLVLSIMKRTRQMSIFSRIFTRTCNYHLIAVMVVAPMLLLLGKRQSLPPPPPRPDELKGLDSDYYKFVVTDWEDPKTSCRDHVLCLLENWTSAVLGPATLLLCMYMFLPVNKSSNAVKLGVAVSMTLTRLGAIASLYQYPKLLYQLNRHHQPRPMDRYTMRLQQLTRLALLVAPFGMASDLSQVWNRLPSKLVVSLLGLGLIPYAKHRLVRGTQARPLTLGSAVRQKLVYAALTVTQLAAAFASGIILVNRWKSWTPPPASSYKILGTAGLCVSILLVGPIGHLIAVRKLFRINYTHDISLANDYDTIQAYLKNPDERQKRFKWRYRLEWREPERIMETISEWKGGFSYWLLFEGGVEDKLRKEFQQEQSSAAYRQGLTVLQRIEQDMKDNPDAPRPDSTQWKANAMKKLAAKHESDYKRGTFEDPLGVAVQQTYGIGLGYQFDHMSELKDGERPSARRLQSRAAKSAVRRAQEIYDAKAVQEELDSIENAEERELKKAEIRRANDAELAYIASQLTELIPTDLVLENKDRQTKIEQFRRDYKKSSSHEIIVDSPEYTSSSSIQSLFGKTDDTNQSDEEFVEAWMRRQQEAEDPDDSTVLV